MSTRNLLNLLEKQVGILAKEIAPLANTPFSTARFDQALFNRHSDKLRDYLQEVKHNMEQLKKCVQDNQTEQVAFLAERLTIQIEALKRELSTQSLRKKESQFEHKQQATDLYHKLAEHQDYERRLLEMINDRELKLNQQTTLSNQQKVQKEIAALAGRLARCRQSMMRIEKSIEYKENTN
ncbi:primosomal replication protein PriC [Photorhabdus cinerea]|uniref:Prephenate dehydrogenase n=1 Tax=Photorhabdus cinerea TaxID=471575 RepID=A0A7X5QDY8_9GAMM|nr:primosomal replication protein [Photorhabdus cinerea]NHB92576.1 prephenate dehydrogenase [Photorhabdus cinerea]